jgi:hypothetical protein
LSVKPDFGISFSRVAAPIQPEVRPIWRISVLAMILLILGRAEKASSKKLLVLSSIVSSARKRALLPQVLSGDASALDLNIRFDPTLDRALDFGLAEGIFELDHGKNVALARRGREFASRIMQLEEVLVTEKEFLRQFKKNDFTEDVIQRLVAG